MKGFFDKLSEAQLNLFLDIFSSSESVSFSPLKLLKGKSKAATNHHKNTAVANVLYLTAPVNFSMGRRTRRRLSTNVKRTLVHNNEFLGKSISYF